MHKYNRQHRIKEVHHGRQKQAMQLNRIVIVEAAVTMPSARKYGKDRRYVGKRMALVAWKFDGRGRVVDEVVVPGSGVVGGSSGVYRRLRGGGNSKYTAIIYKHMHDMTDEKLTVF